MRGAPAIHPKYDTLNEMLAVASQSGASLFFVNRKEQDHEVPMARIRERARLIAADLRGRGVRKGDRIAIEAGRGVGQERQKPGGGLLETGIV